MIRTSYEKLCEARVTRWMRSPSFLEHSYPIPPRHITLKASEMDIDMIKRVELVPYDQYKARYRGGK